MSALTVTIPVGDLDVDTNTRPITLGGLVSELQRLVNILNGKIEGLTGGLTYAGDWSPSSGLFPAQAVNRAIYAATSAGAVGGRSFNIGDLLVAVVDNPSTVTLQGNWDVIPISEAVTSGLGEALERVTTLESAVTFASILRATWAALSATTGAGEGQRAEVDASDTGTHLAASATGYDGASVPNSGTYSFDATWSRWVRVGDAGLASKADRADLDTKADRTDLDPIRSDVADNSLSLMPPFTVAEYPEGLAVPSQFSLLPSRPAPEGYVSVQMGNPVSLQSGDGFAGSVYRASISGQWYADGIAIAGQTGQTYTLSQTDEGKLITCVTVGAAGYQAFTPRVDFGFPIYLTANDLPDGPVTNWINSNEWPLPFQTRVNDPTAASGVVTFGPDAEQKDIVSQQDLSGNGQAYDGLGLAPVKTYTLPDALGSPGTNGAEGDNLGFSIAGITKMPASSGYGWAAANGGLEYDGSSAARTMSVVFLSQDFSTNMLEIDLTSFRPTYWSTSRSPQDVDYDPDADVIWALDIDGQRLNSINYSDAAPSVQTSVAIPADITSVSIVSQADLPSLVLPSSVNMTGVTKAAWIMSSGATATFSLIDLTPGSEGASLHTFDVELQSRQDHIYYCAEDGLLYLTYGNNTSTPSIMVIDPLQGNRLARKELSGIVGIEGLHYDRDKDQMIISRNGLFHAGVPGSPNYPLVGIGNDTNDVRVYDFPVTASRAVDLCWVGRLVNDSGYDFLVALENPVLGQGGYGLALAADENGPPQKGVRISRAEQGPQGAVDDAMFSDINLVYNQTSNPIDAVILYARADADGYTLWVNGTEMGTIPAVNSQGAFGLGKVYICGSTDNRYANAEMRAACLGYYDGRTDYRQKVEGAMAHAHGLTALLPADHPYKTAAPRA